MKRNAAARVMTDAADRLSALVPASWQVTVDAAGSRDTGVDGYLTVRAADGGLVRFLVHVKGSSAGGADATVAQVLRYARRHRLAPLLIVPYAGPGLRRACEQNNVNYLDQTGWVWVRSDTPAMAIRTSGAARDPRPARGTAMRRLSGSGAGRTIRALLAVTEPVGVRALADRADVAPGTVSKVLKALAPEDLVDQDSAGRVLSVRKRDLVERWIQDYRFTRANDVGWYLAPRGVQQVVDLAASGVADVVGTGSVALRRYLPPGRVPVTPLVQLALYTANVRDAVGALGLVPTEPATANVVVATPYDPELLRRESTGEPQLAVVDIGQTLADLMTLPGRGPEEADQLVELLAEEDPAWR
jgi:hypothetical protein